MGIAVGMKEIAQGIASSHYARIADIGRLKADVGQLKKEAGEMLGGFRADHKDMGGRLKMGLDKDKSKMMADIRAMRDGFQASREDMRQKLETDLTQHITTLKSEIGGLLSGFQESGEQDTAQLRKNLGTYNRGIKSSVSGMRRAIRSDLNEARTSWHGLAGNKEPRKGGVTAPQRAAAAGPEKETTHPKKERAARKRGPVSN